MMEKMKRFRKIVCFAWISMTLVMFLGMRTAQAEVGINITGDVEPCQKNTTCMQYYNKCLTTAKKLEKEAVSRYGLFMELDISASPARYKIYMSGISVYLKDVKDDIKFVIDHIEYEDATTGNEDTYSGDEIVYYNNGNKTLTAADKIIVKRLGTRSGDVVGFGTTTVVLKWSGYKDPDIKENCQKYEWKVGNKTYSASFGISKFRVKLASSDAANSSLTSDEKPKGDDDVKLDTTELPTKGIDWRHPNNYREGSFERSFADAMQKATEVRDISKVHEGRTLTCSMTNYKIDDDYYVNKKYYYHTDVQEHSDYYTYNYGCGVVQKKASCKVTCTEVVTIEYGPPVASKAGLCFEYKVRATSRVNCHSDHNDIISDDNNPTKVGLGGPRAYNGFCTPTPACDSDSSVDLEVDDHNNQGGPNDDFDQCINKCDGGKYTTKCSQKCYKQVYDSSFPVTGGEEISYQDVLDNKELQAEKLAYVNRNGKAYGYYCNDKNQMIWVNGKQTAYYKNHKITDFRNTIKSSQLPRVSLDEGYSYEDARWYWSYNWGYRHKKCDPKKMSNTSNYCRHNRYQCYKRTGIPAVCGCKEYCQWIGCRGEVYINPSYLDSEKKAKNHSIIKYIKGAGASDWRKNANIYNNLKSKCLSKAICSTKTSEYTIKVKYKTDSQDGNQFRNGSGNLIGKRANTLTDVIISKGGCYDYRSNSNDSSLNPTYLAEWTLPSSWLSAKYGELSYTRPVAGDFVKQNHKFCLPFNAKNTNGKWWRYYYTKLHGDNKTLDGMTHNGVSYISSAYYDEFKRKCLRSEWRIYNLTDYEPNYNIEATAEKFGMFEWKFDIKCFYAINNTPTLRSSECKGKNEMVIRTVDLPDLFPSKKGDPTTNPATTGRRAGLNWTQFATNEVKDPNYKSNPAKYLEWVQSNGYRVYSNDYLDYDIDLTKARINTLKNRLSNNDVTYNDYGRMDTSGNITVYRSALLRDVLGLQEGRQVPKVAALKCNNMKNVRSAECQNFN